MSYNIDLQLDTRMLKFVNSYLNHCNNVCKSLLSPKLHCINPIQHRVVYALYDISWDPFRPHCVFENYTAFCNKNRYSDKISCFHLNSEKNYSKLFFRKLVMDYFIITS